MHRERSPGRDRILETLSQALRRQPIPRGQLTLTSETPTLLGQLMWMPEIAREITSRCTSEVPSKIV